jgi:hypothetical protein
VRLRCREQQLFGATRAEALDHPEHASHEHRSYFLCGTAPVVRPVGALREKHGLDCQRMCRSD